jgi:HK97 family phage portal protein
MNLWDRLLGRTENRTLDFESLAHILGAVPTAAGISVSAETALRSPTTLACCNAIAQTAGMLPIAVRRRQGEGWTKVTDHPASTVLNGFANPWTSSEQLRTAITMDALLHRNGGFAQVVRVRGEPRELHRLDPRAVSVKHDEASGEPRYEVQHAKGGTITLPWSDVIHLVAPGSTPERPMAPVDLAREAIALDILLAQHESKVFAGGGVPRLFLSPDESKGAIAPEALANAIAFVKKQLGQDVAQPVMLPASFKDAVKAFGLRDMEFDALRQRALEDVARAFRVPPQIVGDLSRATYSNAEQMGRQFLSLCLLPWLEAWESALTRALVPAAEREKVELEFVVADLLRGDTAARFASYRTATGGSVMTRNEARGLEGLPPLPEGDVLLNQAGQTDAATPPQPQDNANA